MQSRVLQEEFTKWAFSNVLDNSTRGLIAEYLVFLAVDGRGDARVNWDAFDVAMQDGTKIEVKTSGYLQSWPQKKPSILTFDISKKDPWLAAENRFLGKNCRYADIWVFAVHTETEIDKADPFDTKQWQFLVTTSTWLDTEFKEQKTVRYSTLCSKGLKPVEYPEISKAIQSAKHEALSAVIK